MAFQQHVRLPFFDSNIDHRGNSATKQIYLSLSDAPFWCVSHTQVLEHGPLSLDDFLSDGADDQFPAVNFVLKYEQLDEDLRLMLQILGVPSDAPLVRFLESLVVNVLCSLVDTLTCCNVSLTMVPGN